MDGTDVHIIPVIKGLESEVEVVRSAFEEVGPDKVAISISKEELDGLRSMPDDFEPELSRYEEMYAKELGRFGEVAAPPPCYVAALELADHSGIPLVPVDLDEASYSDLYCRAVGGTDLFRHSTRTWLLKRKNFRAETPEEFVVQWDRRVNNLECFRTIESKRVEAMVEGIRTAAKGSRGLLAVVELERAGEVASSLKEKE
ncbi:MAG: hypothetical protein MUE55_08540 [Thermoplasmata archaeon]|nr:hypothetical protein [Thermoplasmata archaeon]